MPTPTHLSLPARRRHRVLLEHADGATSAFSAVAGAPIDVVLDALVEARRRGAPEVVAVTVAGVHVPRSAAWDELLDLSAGGAGGRP